MDFEKLYEALSLAEGTVVSFQDFKNKKEGKAPIELTIKEVVLKYCECRIDKTIPLGDFSEGRRFHYEQFQDWLYKNDYFVKQEDERFKCNFTLHIGIKQGDIQKEEAWDCRLTVGGDDLDLQKYVENRLITMYGGVKNETIVFTQEAIAPGNYEEEYANWEHKKEKKQEEPVSTLQGTDKKDPMEVAVGDILTCSFGYDMTIVHFYKVIERKPKSIKITKLKSKRNLEDSTVMPIDVTETDNEVDGKLFRIGQYAVASISRYKNLYYWDGKSKHFNDYN